MLETRIKFTGTLEQDLRDYIESQYGNERGAINFTIKQALIRFLETEMDKIRERRKQELISEMPTILGKAIARTVIENQKEEGEQKGGH